jgi:UDP-2-acetamido-3-amino-2,3-dideoxy-glucuronate N-acetyltransferase
MMVGRLSEPRLIQIPHFGDERGVLSVIDWEDSLPFVPKRFYYILNTHDGVKRGKHAHWEEGEVVLALSGSFTVLADDGTSETTYRLDRPDAALYIPPMIWHELYEFSADAVCAVFASERFNIKDYCCDYEQFLRARRQQS